METTLETPHIEKLRDMAVELARISNDHDGRCYLEKLHALMYWTDSEAHHTLGASISRALYRHRPWGPWPAEWAQVQQAVTDAGHASITHHPRFTKVDAWLTITAPPEHSILNETERIIIRSVAERYTGMDDDQIRRLACREPAYASVRPFQVVPFQAIPLDTNLNPPTPQLPTPPAYSIPSTTRPKGQAVPQHAVVNS